MKITEADQQYMDDVRELAIGFVKAWITSVRPYDSKELMVKECKMIANEVFIQMPKKPIDNSIPERPDVPVSQPTKGW